MKDKNKRLMLIVSILVLGIGLTFAYFVVGVNILGTGGSTKLATSDLIRVKYDAGTGKLATSGLNPGHSVSKGFKVTVTPTKTVQEVTYRIFLNITSNTFEVCSDSNYNSITNDCEKDAEELIYILKDGNGNEITRGDLTNGVIGEVELARETKKVATETDYNYTIEIEFKDTNKDQNHNQSKTIQGEVKVEFAEPDTSDLNIMAVYVEKEDKPGKYDSVDEIPVNKQFDNIKSYCEVNGERVSGLEFNYDMDSGTIGIDKIRSKGTKCYLYFDKIQGQTSSSIIADIEKSTSYKGETTPTFGTIATGAETAANNGIYKVADGMYNGYSYYWRGNATTNHVIFDGKCWRIVRINGDKSIRLIYNGTPSGNTCTQGANSAAVIMGSSNEEKYYATSDGKYDNPSYAGWTYTLNSQRTTSGTASNAKTQTEKWYNSNISDAAKLKVDDKGKFCGDRDVSTPPTKWNWSSGSYVTTWSAWSSSTSKYFAYAGAKRLYQDYAPTLSCPSGDVYSLSVGAISADEVEFAGGKNENNTSYYLNASANYWTMSPYRWYNGHAHVFGVDTSGDLGGYNMYNTNLGLRPVINLKSDTVFAVDGNGTSTSPYVVS